MRPTARRRPGTAHHPRRDRRPKDPHPDHRTKFTGRFNKGVDYVGDVKQFEKNSMRPRGHRVCDQEIRPAAVAEIERPFRQRQVFHLRTDAPGVEEI